MPQAIRFSAPQSAPAMQVNYHSLLLIIDSTLWDSDTAATMVTDSMGASDLMECPITGLDDYDE